MKRLIGDIKYVIVTMWAKGETGEDTGLTLIARGILILAFMSLAYIVGTLFTLIRWIVL